ncbi:MAG TPA: diacylglycerol kinase family protein [Chloroflexi bacterium]|nr:diacylglycerol kinase family protein [Chloroflexota bacterium]
MSKTPSRIQAFRHAFEGLGYLLHTQPNARIHAAATVGVVALGLWLRLEARSWALLAAAITVVWAAEAGNTALEALVDLVSPEVHPTAKAAKDTAAASVLLAASGAVVIGLLVLGPPLWHRLAAFLP